MGNPITTILKGGALGLSMIIPGVSGGTMALIMGIYERMLAAINSITPGNVKALLLGSKDDSSRSRSKAAAEMDILFLTMLGIGAAIIILIMAKVLPLLMTNHHDPTYGFFWGLILASIIVPLKMIKRFTWKEGVTLLLGLALTAALSYKLDSSSLPKAQKKAQLKFAMQELKQNKEKSVAIDTSFKDVDVKHLAYIFLAASVAISACVLPGVSGSFVLVLFGVYMDVLESVNRVRAMSFSINDLLVVGVTALGCLGGLLAFTRLLDFVFKKYYNPTIGFLLGLMVGSLYGIWPFREATEVVFPKGAKMIYGSAQLPEMNGNFWLTVLTTLAGVAVIIAFEIVERKNKNGGACDATGAKGCCG